MRSVPIGDEWFTRPSPSSCAHLSTATRSAGCPRAAPPRSTARSRPPPPCIAPGRCRRGSGPRSSTAPRSCSASASRSSRAPSPRRRPSRSRPRRVEARACGVDVHVRRGRSRGAHRRDGADGRRRRRRGQARRSRCACRSAWSARSARSTSRSTSSRTSSRPRSPRAARWC